jgi:hypothetical protein
MRLLKKIQKVHYRPPNLPHTPLPSNPHPTNHHINSHHQRDAGPYPTLQDRMELSASFAKSKTLELATARINSLGTAAVAKNAPNRFLQCCILQILQIHNLCILDSDTGSHQEEHRVMCQCCIVGII